MTLPTHQVYSATWDTKFLELPQRRMLLAKFNKVPTRPTAHIELFFEEDTNAVVVKVIEKGRQPMTNFAARYDGDKLELGGSNYDAKTQESIPVWYPWNDRARFQSEKEALCWMVLLMSDVSCPGQARVDMPKALASSLWTKLWDEMRNLHPVASVMLT